MRERVPLTIDMTPGGAFVPPPRRATWPLKVGLGAAALAAVAGALALAALFLWVASVLLPVALVAAAIAYAAFRFQGWRLRHCTIRRVGVMPPGGRLRFPARRRPRSR